MRISTNLIFRGGLDGILDGQARAFELQQKISSGKRVETPGDDPLAASQIISVKNQLALVEQYQKNADVAESRLRLEEEVLGSIKNAVDRVRELAIQAGDGALAQRERAGIAVELEQRLDQLLGMLNSKDINNQYLFSGYQSGVKPFDAAAGGGFNYLGDEGQLFIQIAESLDVAVSDSGKSIFLDVDEPLNFTAVANAANTGTALLTNQVVLNQAEFDEFHPDGATITFSVVGGVTTYSVTRVSDGSPIVGGSPPQALTNVNFIPDEPIEFEGIHITAVGTPADGDTIDITSDAPTKLDLLGAVEKLQLGLRNSGDGSIESFRREELIADTLLSLDGVLSNVSDAQARIGARLNTIEDARSAHADRELISREVISRLEDLDFAEAISNLTQQTFTLEAAQQSFVRISNLSLFNLL